MLRHTLLRRLPRWGSPRGMCSSSCPTPVVSLSVVDPAGGYAKTVRLHERWVREQCGPVHEPTGQRLFDVSDTVGKLAGLPTVKDEGRSVEFRFEDGAHGTFLTKSLIRAVDPSFTTAGVLDLATKGYSVVAQLPARVPWSGVGGNEPYGQIGVPDLRRFDLRDAGANRDDLLGNLCAQLLTFGAAVVKNVPREEGEILNFCSSIGPVRTTDWGVHFDVRTVQAREAREDVLTEDVAYTDQAIDLHHDNPYREPIPGFWCLHCLQDSPGGESLISDGLHAALQLREHSPWAFDVLSKTEVTFAYRSEDVLLQNSVPHIQLGDRRHGRGAAGDDFGIRQVTYSGRLDAIPGSHYTPEELDLYYRARSLFLDTARTHSLHFKLEAGDLIIIDNTRVMHGRTQIEQGNMAKHPRFLQGCYIDSDAVTSRYHLMKKAGMRAWEETARLVGGKLGAPHPSEAARVVSVALGPLRSNGGAAPRPSPPAQAPQVTEPRSPRGPPALGEVVSFTAMVDGTEADYDLMAACYQEACGPRELAARALGLLRQQDTPEEKHGAQVTLYDHAVQSATRALRDGQGDDIVVAALLHDIGELISPSSHGDIAAGILAPYLTPEAHWILAHHEVFQGYYYYHHVGGDKNAREIYKHHEHYQACVNFCEKYDQASFDPNYDSLPLSAFESIVERVFAREAYWWSENHPKKVAVTGIQH